MKLFLLILFLAVQFVFFKVKEFNIVVSHARFKNGNVIIEDKELKASIRILYVVNVCISMIAIFAYAYFKLK